MLTFQLTMGHMSHPSHQSWTQELYIVVWLENMEHRELGAMAWYCVC